LKFHCDQFICYISIDFDFDIRSGTFDGSSRFRTVFKNGVLVASGTASAVPIITGVLSISGYQYTMATTLNYAAFIGAIDTFRFWTRTLTTTEIINTFNNIAVSTSGLYFAYNFNQVSGTSITDYSGGTRTLFMTYVPAIYELDYTLCF
jgi:hypothetical protein